MKGKPKANGCQAITLIENWLRWVNDSGGDITPTVTLHSVAIYFAYYNFCGVHQRLSTPEHAGPRWDLDRHDLLRNQVAGNV